MLKINSIRKTYFFSLVLISLILLIILSLFFVYQKYRDFENESDRQRKEFLDYQKELIKAHVDRTIDFIEFNKEKIKEQARKSGDYKDVENKIKQDILAQIQRIRFGEGGYIFISQYDGIVLAHHRPEHIGSDLSDLTDPDGVKIHQVILQAGKKPEGGFTEYVGTKNPVTGKPGEKITFVRSIDNWEWLVSAGFYADNIEPFISANKKQLAKKVISQLLYTILIFLIITVIATLIINKLSKRISEQFNLLTKYFQKSSTTYEKIDKEELPYEEFKVLSDSVNEMVDARKQAEKALRDNEEKYRMLIEQSDQMIYDYDIPTGKINWSGNILTITGCSPEEFQKIDIYNWEKLIHLDDRKCALDILDEAMKTCSNFKSEYRFKKKDKTYLYIEDNGIFLVDEKGEAKIMFGIMKDITERKLAEQELQKQREHLEELVKERTKELEKNTNKLEKSRQSLALLLKDVNESRAELDVSNKHLQAANEELEAFAYSVSHDLRAPLRSIDGFSQILLEDYSDILEKQGQHYLQRVRAGTQNMGQLIDNILNLSHVGRTAMKKNEINIKTIAKEVYESMKDECKDRKVKFTVHKCPVVFADPNLLRIVLNNLISNALKFTRAKKIAEIEIGSEMEDKQTVFYVKDNGAGFDMKYADKLFSPFQRLHRKEEYEGTGIGLAIVQRIIHRHGGKIWVESKPEKKTIFYFTLKEK